MRRAIMTSCIAAAIAAAALGEGRLGQKAAPLEGLKWIKGKPVNVAKSDGKHVYVVEFWATWCGPCRRAIPRLTELQKKYKGKVTFVGISDEKPDVVRKFVEQQGSNMGYSVAADPARKVYNAYMKAFGIGGIPHAFVVGPKGRILWHGHPMAELEDVLEQMLAGRWDVEKARAEIERRERQQRAMMKALTLLSQYFRLAADKSEQKKAREVGEQILEVGAAAPQILNQLSWQILTKEGLAFRDLKLALRAAEMANRATDGKDPAILDTYALALFENGRKAEAVRIQERAVRLARGTPQYRDIVPELEQRLKRYRGETP